MIETEDKNYYRWIVVGVSFATLALSYTVMYSFSIFFVALLKEFNWSRSLTAGAFSVFWIIHGLIGPIVGRLVDRFGSRRIFLLGSLFLGGGLASCSLIASSWQLYLFFSIISAIGVAATGWVPNTTAIQNWFEEKRGLAMGIISSGVGIGIFICIPSVQHLIVGFGWRITYLIMAICIPLSISLMAILFLKNRAPRALSDPGKEKRVVAARRVLLVINEEWASRPWTLRQAMLTRQFLILSICFLFSGSITQSILTHHVAFFVDEGLGPLFASYIVGLTGIVSIVGKILWGTLSDRIGREITYTLVTACSICGMLSLIAFTVLSSSYFPYLYALFFGLGYAGLATLPPLIIADFFEGKAYGEIFGTLFILNGAGGALGAWIAGFVHDHQQTYVPFFIMMIACALIACAVLWVAAPRRIRSVPGKGRHYHNRTVPVAGQ